MHPLRRYRSRPDNFILAVQINLDIQGFSYTKWGSEQRCKRGDWLVDNKGDVYTVERDVFSRTYRQLSPGVFVKASPVWARVADQDGSIRTKEGTSRYRAGDYLVFNDPDGSDGYCMGGATFASLYEPDD
jgi:hypothetical protein